jgi:glycosyltransferase involved in cell wall biosynthesis
MKTPLPTLSTRLAATEPKNRIIYVSTYIPRECGIATYTKDLTNAINILNPHRLADIIAIDDAITEKQGKKYPWEVKYKIQQNDKDSWTKAAEYINQSSAEVIHLQHEFGIYGGQDGEWIMDFVDEIKKPIVVTLHTVLPDPSENQKRIVEHISRKATGIIVMVRNAVNYLVKTYNVDSDKIVVIPHGVPDMPFTYPDKSKKTLGLEKYNIISGFGLINRGKGYEYAIKAMPKILKKHPMTKLLILGQTHPVVLRQFGEVYREELIALAKDLGIEDSIIFVNKYLSLQGIIQYLQATDIYITPFPGLSQITSGTLSYAIGAGRACISTPYLYAQEVINDERGLLVPPNDPDKFSEAAITLLDDPEKRLEISKKAYAYGRNMIWPSVALKHLDLFEIITKESQDALPN